MINDVTFVMKRHKVYSPQLKLKMILKTIQNKVLISQSLISKLVWTNIRTPHIELDGWLDK